MIRSVAETKCMSDNITLHSCMMSRVTTRVCNKRLELWRSSSNDRFQYGGLAVARETLRSYIERGMDKLTEGKV